MIQVSFYTALHNNDGSDDADNDSNDDNDDNNDMIMIRMLIVMKK